MKTRKARKPTKKQKAKSDLISLIISHALNEVDVNYFIYDLEAELRSIYLIRDGLKLPVIIGQVTELERDILKLPKKEVLDTIKELRKKFPYVKKD